MRKGSKDTVTSRPNYRKQLEREREKALELWKWLEERRGRIPCSVRGKVLDLWPEVRGKRVAHT